MPAISPTMPTDIFHGRRFNAYNDWMRRHYGGRWQKISLNAGFTCPNRDASLGLVGGCSFCNNEGFSPSYLRRMPDVLAQIDTGVEFLRRRYPDVQGFFAYLQSYSNTYADLSELKSLYTRILAHPEVSGLVIGTRPDCLPDEVLDYLALLAKTHFIELEIGIESCSDAVLRECQRGHDVACTLDAIQRAAKRGLFITGHLLLGLPLETHGSLMTAAQSLAQLPLAALKFHQLQIMRHTRLGAQYQNNPASIALFTPEQYIDVVIDMLEYLPPSLKIQRLGSEVPPSIRLSPDWGMRLERYPVLFEERLLARDTWQGKLFVRLGDDEPTVLAPRVC